jgi:Lamin Tail Domain
MPAELCANGMDDDMDGATDCMDTKCATAAACGKLLINEVDYDQPMADAAEYIELYNAGTTEITLDGVEVVLVNGNGGVSAIDQTIALTGTVTPGQYFILASAGVMNVDPNAVVQTLDVAIQNGAPDAILLRDATHSVGLDAICYECAAAPMLPININGKDYPLVAGMVSTVADTAPPASLNRSIIRFPNGTTTGNDSVDWRNTTILTPGGENKVVAEVCLDGMMLDEDADDLVDCADPDCSVLPACVPPEICDNNMDEDGDMMIDCADSDCDTKACGANGLTCSMNMCACPGGTMEMTCNDMMDNDCDGKSDCDDTDCAAAPACVPPEVCNNNLDDDGDMMVDCADADCDTKACGANGLTCSMNMCACPGGTMEMTCNDMMDNDCDGKVDCNDSDCTGTPACSVEICDNGLDEDGDMLTDCADSDCNNKACGMNGLVCNMNMCACPSGMTMEAMCNDMMDEDCDGMIDCADSDCAMAPACNLVQVASVDYPVIAHGGSLVITGSGFMGATGVTIGGTNEMFVVNSDTQITIAAVDDATPIALQNLVVTTATGMAQPFGVTVIRLQINEIDSDSPGTDAAEFVEISTGVPNVSLAKYSMVFFNGNLANDTSYLVMELNGTTDANGLLVLGNMGVVPMLPMTLTFAGNGLQNGPDAVALYQALPAAFPMNTAATTTKLIDVLVYETNDADDVSLLDTFFGAGNPTRVQVDEGAGGANGPAEMNAIQRCSNGRRDGRKFGTSTPTPGAVNNIMACP